MKRCPSFQSQLLDHLYGLLDAEESQELAEHLEQCGACQEALVRAEGHQQQLARAARMEFAGVHFEEPVARRIVDEDETPPAGSPGWFRWSVAAAILLAIAGMGIPTGLYSQQQDRVDSARARLERLNRDAQQLQTQHQTSLDQADKELQEIMQSIQELSNRQQGEVREVQKKIASQPLHLTVTGPKTPDPGAANNYNIRITNRVHQLAPAHVSVRVLDQADQVVYEVKEVPTRGDFVLSLPRDLPLKPRTELALEVTAKAASGPEATLREKLALGAVVYLTHLTTDKPMYHPGEVVKFRSLTLERFSLRPAQEELELVYTITKPNGEQVKVVDGVARLTREQSLVLGPDRQPIRGIGAGEFALDPEARGGEFTLTVSEARGRFLPQERKFLVNQYEKPRLNKELEFTRKSYGPGETVVATCKVARVEGGLPVAQKRVEATVLIDGRSYGADGKEGPSFALKTDDQGGVNVKFQLPATIAKGEASLSVAFHDADVESIVRSIPIVLKKLQVEFFPEGGDLVAGVPNRIYFQARTTLGKPAELKGRILDEQGQVMTDVQTLNDPSQPGANQGQGVFAFVPLPAKKYRLKIDAPSGIEGEYVLPTAKADGVVLTIARGVTTDKDPIEVEVRSARSDRSLLVGAYCRGRLLAHQRLHVKKGEAARVELRPESGVGGVYRVTVFEEVPASEPPLGKGGVGGVGGVKSNLVPRAERLIYREPAERLQLSIQPDKQRYVPGDRVRLQCLAVDEKGQSAPAIVMVAVVDKSVLKLADEKTFKNMPTHFLLGTEVRRPEDLEHADFLVTPSVSPPSKGGDRGGVAHAALDLLLGTQGWRRFAEQDPGLFRKQQPNKDAERLLVLNGQFTPDRLAPQTTVVDGLALQKVHNKYRPQFTPLQEKLARAQSQRTELENDERFRGSLERLEEERAAASRTLQIASVQLNRYQDLRQQARAFLLPVLLLLLVVGGLAFLVAGIVRAKTPLAVPYLATAACSMVLFGMVALVQLDTESPRTFSSVAREIGMPAGGAGGPRDEAAVALMDMDANKRDGKPEAAAKPAAPPRKAMPGPAAPAMEPARLKEGAAKRDGQEKADNLDRRALGLQPMERGRGEAKKAMPGAGKGKQPDDRLGDVAGREALQKDKAFGVPERQAGGLAGAPALNALRLEEAEQLALPPPPAPFVVREYAHQHSSAAGKLRTDLAETLYWHPALVLADGKIEASFDLCDSVTTFQVLAAGHTVDGRLGAVTAEIESRLPITLEPKLPIEVTASDRIDLPLTIANNSDTSRVLNVRVQPTDLALVGGKASERVTLDANQRLRKIYRFRPTILEGEARLRFDGIPLDPPSIPPSIPPFQRGGHRGGAGDSILRSFKVVPDGFPVVGAQSDMLEGSARHDLVLPESWVKGTLKYQVSVYPSTLADLQQGLEALLREPNGCFEQTSTSNYPNLLILDYLKSTDQARPEVARRAQDLIGRGYEKLTSFECLNPSKNQREGYEWFGGTAPAHEALTAYGLMQFRDMARVHDVDKAMLERTRTYLMAQRDGSGGFKRNQRALDTFGRAPDNITNAYIVWALTEGGKEDDLAKELGELSKQAKDSKDPYFLALVANSLLNRGLNDEGIALLKKLIELQKSDGHLDAAQTSITGSGGRDLQIETTALSLLAWLKAKRPDLFNTPVQHAVAWIGKQRGGYGGFGSTQSTILALKALIAFADANKKTAEAGSLILFLADKEVARKDFAAGAADAIVLELADAKDILKPGKNSLRIEMTGKSVFPYTASWSYQTLKPASADNCPVRLETRLGRSKIGEAETVRLTATLANVSGKGQGMALAIIGLPAGLTLPEDMKQLKDLARPPQGGDEGMGTGRGTIDFWEVRGRELVLYWRDLAPGKKVEVNLDLIGRVPGEYRGPASRAYLYYNADHKHWVDPLEVSIAAKSAD